MRLIDADALKKEMLKTYEYEYPTASGAFDEFASRIVPNIISNAPTVDAEPVRHGHWIEAHDNDGLDYECSNRKCQCRISYNGAKVSGDFNYCPNCGAKMDEEAEHEAD